MLERVYLVDEMQVFLDLGSRRVVGIAAALACLTLAGQTQAACLSSEAQGLTRQIAAIRASAEKRGCTGTETGFFSACASYRQRMAEAQRSLQSLSVSTCGAKPQSAYEAEAETVETRDEDRRQPRTPRTVSSQHSGSKNMIATMCVRLSDGYYFPSPNSGYTSAEKEPVIAAQCRLICDTDAMEVFRVDITERTEDSMVSLASGKPYAELPVAGTFRKDAALKRCDLTRYYRLGSKPAGVANAQSAGPDPFAPAAPLASLAITAQLRGSLGETRLQNWAYDQGSVTAYRNWTRSEHIRIIGPQFLPEK